ncbi:MAG: endonuclease [Paludibacteraceae bacterium]|nr:endonuclease [Paludibacteraceae bacterium]
MQRLLSLIAAAMLTLSLSAETYTIVFNSSTSDATNTPQELSNFVLTATSNCVDRLIYSEKVNRAKEGFGIKGGTGSAKGILTLGLDDTYHITTMTIYAATYPHAKDTAATKGFIVYDQTIIWEAGHRTEIRPYSINVNADVDSIFISSAAASYNRWYVQKIEFEAEDPHPGRACVEMQYPKMDFGGVKWQSKEEPMEDVLNLNLTGKNVVGNISLALQKGTTFTLTETSIPAEGGEIGIFYSITMDTVEKAFPIEDVLITKATGSDGIERSRELAIVLTIVPPSSGGASAFVLDTAGMVYGPMPGDYYAYAQGTADSTLKNHLGYIICRGVRYRYGSGSKHSWDAFFHTDRDTLTNEVLDMYSNNHRYFDPESPAASVSGFDIEHMLPKSWWGGEVNPAYCDIYHLVPGDASANRSKSNHAPGVPADSSFYNGSFVTGKDTLHGLTRVFCPADEYKGDFARAYFYIATCYGDSLTWLTSGEPAQAMTNEGWQEFRPWLRDLLLTWHRMDPVSKKELDRAVEVNKIQGNRNPFIDYPELAEYIWGNKQGTAVDFRTLTQSYGDPYDDGSTTAIGQTPSAPAARKQLRDGKLIILRNESVYTPVGQKLR